MRHIYWYITTFIKKHGWIVLVSLVGAVTLFSFLVPLLVSQITFKKTQYVGLVGEYTLDSLPTEITEQISYGLMMVQTSDYEVVPALAEKYTISDDGKTYTFTIKPELHWPGELSSNHCACSLIISVLRVASSFL